MKPKLLDLFCGAGGCTKGYQMAGFHVTGVDIKKQPRYCGDEFIQGDALDYLREHGAEYDVIHASPPCQLYGRLRFLAKKEHPMLIEETRELLIATGKIYVIENVPGAPLINPTIIRAAMFGMLILRDRLFESNVELPFLLSPQNKKASRLGEAVADGDVLVPAGHFIGVEYARQQMGIDWMTRNELSQAIPPAYTELIGKHILEKHL